MTMQQQDPDAVEIELDDKPSKVVPLPTPKPQAPQAPVSPIPGMLARIAAAFGITELLALVPAISALVSINGALRDQLQAAFKAKRSDIWARAMPYVSGLFYHMARNWAPAVAHVTKFEAMKRGERIVTGEAEMDQIESLVSSAGLRGLRSLPNPNQVGTLDRYVAWLDATTETEPSLNQVIANELGLGTAASEASANASVQASGSLAQGTMAGVGFTSAQGYMTALAHGVKQATADQYLAILRTRYQVPQAEIETLVVNIIPESGLPVGLGIAHVPTGPDIFSRPRAERLAFMGAAAQRVMAEPEAKPILSAGNMVAGAGLDAEGVILGWYGAGELALSAIKAALVSAGFPDVWAPASKSNVAHVGFALAPLTNGGNVVRSDRGGRKKGDRLASTDGRMRAFAGRWIVLTPATRGDVGDHAGRINLTAVLFTDGRLELTGPTDVCERVNADYVRRVSEERFPAAEVTMWLRDTLIRRFGAITMGPAGWYVPNRHVAAAERLCGAMAEVWGAGWILPGLPITTGERLFAGIVRGLASEVATVLTDLEASEAQAKKQGQSQLGARGAATFMRRLREVNDRAKGYATVLGAKHVAAIRDELTKALARVEPLCDDTAERFAMLDMD